jgi:hypothetical protein
VRLDVSWKVGSETVHRDLSFIVYPKQR